MSRASLPIYVGTTAGQASGGNHDDASALGFITLLLTLCLATGCNRAYYRLQTDQEVADLVQRGCYDPCYQIKDFTIRIGPHSRMFDPTCPDQSPMPPDDPAAHKLMHCVDCKSGWKGWHRNGDAPDQEYYDWLDYLPTDEQGRVVVDMEQVIELGQVHSRNYQLLLEELYLSAMDVTFERFRFDSQFFGGNQTRFFSQGPLIAPPNGSNTLTTQTFNSTTGTNGVPHATNTIGATQLFPAGGQLLTEVANSLVWQFTGPDQFNPTTLLHFSFTQPLLRFAGRRRVLETLTLTERTVLYNLRAMARYRQAFYVDTITGRDSGGTGPSRRGGVTGQGLTGFAGVGQAGFGNLATTQNTGSTGGFAGAGAGAAQAGGFLGLLQDLVQIDYQRANVDELRRSYERLNDLVEAGRIEPLQANQAAQALANATSVLLTLQTQYQTAVDNFVINELGLPPDLPFMPKDEILAPFELLNADLKAFERSTEDQVREITSSLDEDEERPVAALAAGSKALETFDKDMEQVRKKLLPLVKKAVDEMGQAAKTRRDDLEKLKRVAKRREADLDLDERRKTLDEHVKRIQDDLARLQNVFAEQQDEPDPPPLPRLGSRQEEDVWRQWRDSAPLEHVRAVLRQHLEETQRQLAENSNDATARSRAEDLYGYAWEFIERLKAHAQEMSLVFARARLESITVPWNELDSHEALQIASDHRLDWMNARAALVDTWRLIEFNANALKSGLSITLDGTMRNRGNSPFDFSGNATTGFAQLQFDAPLNRLNERNVYRQSLIEFQRARRNYMLFVDRISQVLRLDLRSMELNQLNFELRRQAVWTAIASVEQAQLRLTEPPRVGADATQETLGPTTARDLVTALSDLLSTQNDFLSVWVNYLVLRIQLDMDLGTMCLDGRGVWVDPGQIGLPREWAACNFEEDLSNLPPGMQEILRPMVLEQDEEVQGDVIEPGAVHQHGAESASDLPSPLPIKAPQNGAGR